VTSSRLCARSEEADGTPAPDPPRTMSTTPAISLRTKITFAAIAGVLALAVGLPLREMATSDAGAERIGHLARIATQELRAAIENYQRDHGRWPGHAPGSDEPDVRWFTRQLTRFSNENGEVFDELDPEYNYGPYLVDALPDNPVNGLSDVRYVPRESIDAAVDEMSGWLYDPKTGVLRINASGSPGPGQRPYADL